ncbi:hypothetical protein ACFVMC_05235 [Nocardia sp. NPDC127579]|uniref:hypothetical protein n=1 Tax=Nocardia sp. NPDC127579 TaxID=3345402 RepID=UPI00363B267F
MSYPGGVPPQQPYGQQPYGQQMPPPGVPGAQGITIQADYMWMAFMLGLLTKPKILINGQKVPVTQWGENHIPLGPGQYHLRVSTPWINDMGPAEQQLMLAPGQSVRYYYKPPTMFWMRGAMGETPQSTPGMWIYWVLLALIALPCVLGLLITVVGIAAA